MSWRGSSSAQHAILRATLHPAAAKPELLAEAEPPTRRLPATGHPWRGIRAITLRRCPALRNNDWCSLITSSSPGAQTVRLKRRMLGSSPSRQRKLISWRRRKLAQFWRQSARPPWLSGWVPWRRQPGWQLSAPVQWLSAHMAGQQPPPGWRKQAVITFM